MIPVEILYDDLSCWRGTVDTYGDSPIQGLIRVSIFHPTEEYEVEAVGWDYYGITQEVDRIRLSLWKEDDAKDADGSDDPYAGMGFSWFFYPDGGQERTEYMDADDLPESAVIRDGIWVDNETARIAGIL